MILLRLGIIPANQNLITKPEYEYSIILNLKAALHCKSNARPDSLLTLINCRQALCSRWQIRLSNAPFLPSCLLYTSRCV